MNKIVIDKDKFLSLDNEEVIIQLNTDNINLNILGNVIINEIVTKYKNINLKITMNDNSSLIYNRYVHKVGGKLNLEINSNNNTKLIFNNSFYLKNYYKIYVYNNILGNNNKNTIDIKSFNVLNGKIKALGYVDIFKNTNMNNLVENFNIITNNDEENLIIPSIIANSFDVDANHFTTISSIPKSELFYLSLKGIKEEESKKLLRNSFILKNFNNDFIKDKIKKLLEKE